MTEVPAGADARQEWRSERSQPPAEGAVVPVTAMPVPGAGVAPVALRGRVAVLIPCYNEEASVAKVVLDHRAALPEADIWVYDNNSTDRTVAVVHQLQAGDPHLHLRREFRQGKGNVIRSMFRDIDADCYLMIDGDDTYPAEADDQMVRAVLVDGIDMVIGDRLSSTYFQENKRPFHNLGNVTVRRMINTLFGCSIHDVMTGHRAFSRPFVKGFPVLSGGFEIETEMTIHAVDKKFSYREIPVDYRDRAEGSVSKLNTYSDGFKVITTIFRLLRDYRPMRFFGTVAALIAVVALVLGIPPVLDFFRIGSVPRYPSLIVASALGVAALVTTAIGIILQVEVQKHRQLYEVMTNYYLSLDHLVRADRRPRA